MTTPTWRPFVDAPLFTAELLNSRRLLPGDLAAGVSAYLSEVAAVRTAPLHTCTAFNALHFGFDVQTRNYRAEVLDPDLFTVVTPGPRPVLPIGNFVRLDRGQHSLWAEVVARYGHDPAVDATDGWVPAAVSGAPGTPAPDGTWHTVERAILDFEAFGSPLTAVERAELHRARLRGNLLDLRGHLIGPVTYPPSPSATGHDDDALANDSDADGINLDHPSAPDVRDDVAWYSAYLLGQGRPLLLGGPLGGLLTDDDDTVLAAALREAFRVIDRLLDDIPSLHRFGGYAASAQRVTDRNRTGWPGLPPSDIDEVARAVFRATNTPRYTAVWPLLTAQVARHDSGEDPLELAGAADVLVHTNLAAVGRLRTPGRPRSEAQQTDGDAVSDDVRIDDVWLAGGVWRAQQPPVPERITAVDPLQPRGLGYGDSLPTGVQSTPDSESRQQDGETSEQAGNSSQIDGDGPQQEQTCFHLVGEGDKSADDREGAELVVDGPGPDGLPVVADVAIFDSLIVCAVTLRESHLDGDLLPIASASAAVLADGPLVVELHHDGDPLDDTERVHHVTAETTSTGEGASTYLLGVAWPLSFHPGIKVRVAVVRGARRINVSTTLLETPSPLGEEFRWDADQALLAASLGLPPPQPGETTTQHPADDLSSPRQPDRHRGVDQLHTMIVSAIRQHGHPGAFGARRLTGPQLLAAMFGNDIVDPRLLWQVIYTCERLTDRGKLTSEPNPANPDRPGSGGPDTFVWWPDDIARRPAQHSTEGHTSGSLAGHVREQWVPPHFRLLPDGYRASDAARDAYAAWIRKVRGPDADTDLPGGYTFVRGGPRGSVQDGSWIHMAATALVTPPGTG